MINSALKADHWELIAAGRCLLPYQGCSGYAGVSETKLRFDYCDPIFDDFFFLFFLSLGMLCCQLHQITVKFP